MWNRFLTKIFAFEFKIVIVPIHVPIEIAQLYLTRSGVGSADNSQILGLKGLDELWKSTRDDPKVAATFQDFDFKGLEALFIFLTLSLTRATAGSKIFNAV